MTNAHIEAVIFRYRDSKLKLGHLRLLATDSKEGRVITVNGIHLTLVPHDLAEQTAHEFEVIIKDCEKELFQWVKELAIAYPFELAQLVDLLGGNHNENTSK